MFRRYRQVHDFDKMKIVFCGFLFLIYACFDLAALQTERMTPLETWLKQQHLDFELIPKANTVHTADAASATGIPLERITKSLVCLDGDQYAYVAVIPGTHRLRPKAVAKTFGVKKIRLCPFEEAHRYSGYPPGATPPLHHAAVKGVVIDRALLHWDEIYGGGGTNETLLKLRTEDLVRLTGNRVADLSIAPASG